MLSLRNLLLLLLVSATSSNLFVAGTPTPNSDLFARSDSKNSLNLEKKNIIVGEKAMPWFRPVKEKKEKRGVVVDENKFMPTWRPDRERRNDDNDDDLDNEEGNLASIRPVREKRNIVKVNEDIPIYRPGRERRDEGHSMERDLVVGEEDLAGFRPVREKRDDVDPVADFPIWRPPRERRDGAILELEKKDVETPIYRPSTKRQDTTDPSEDFAIIKPVVKKVKKALNARGPSRLEKSSSSEE